MRPLARSPWFDSFRHLLRHLHDPPGLNRNPIFATYFLTGLADRRAVHDAMLAVQGAVRRAAEALSTRANVGGVINSHYSRQSAIIIRCDLGRESKASVARDLGLSRSYYFRERHDACVFVSEFLRAYVAQRASEYATIVDPVKSEFARIDALFHAGEVSLAVARLEQFILSAPDRATRMIGYCTLVGFLAYIGRPGEARLALQTAAECYSAIVDGAASTAELVADCRIRFLVARSCLMAGTDIRSAKADLDEAIGSFDHTRTWRDRSLAEVMISASVQQVHFALILGDVDSAERALARAEGLLHHVADATVVERCDFLGARAGPSLHKGLLGDAVSALRAGLELTRGGPFPHEMMNLLIGLSRAFEYGGECRAASAVLRWCGAIASSMDTGSYPARVARLRIGDLDRANGDRQSSRERVLDAGSTSYFSVVANLSCAEQLIQEQHYERALRALSESSSIADRMGYQKEALRAMLLQAHAMAALSKRGEAATVLEAALERAAALRSPHWLRRSFAASAALTGNRHHASCAESLLGDLRRRLSDGLDGGVSELIELERHGVRVALGML
jgi:hypothetical protein